MALGLRNRTSITEARQRALHSSLPRRASLDTDIRQTFALTKHKTFHTRNIDIPYNYIDNTVEAGDYRWEPMRKLDGATVARLAEDRTMFTRSLALFLYLGPSRRRALEDDNWEYGGMS